MKFILHAEGLISLIFCIAWIKKKMIENFRFMYNLYLHYQLNN